MTVRPSATDLITVAGCGSPNDTGGSVPTLCPATAPSTPSSCGRAPPSFVLRPFRSLSSLHSTGSTDEALAAMEKTMLGPEPPPIESPLVRAAHTRGGDRQPAAVAENDSCGEQQAQRHQPDTDWRSLNVAAMLSFCSAVQFSLYFSSMWPYLQVLDNAASERFFGYIVAAYSLGQILGSPLFGYISNRLRKIRHLLYAGLLLMFLGNTVYMVVHLFPSWERKFLLVLARFVTGIGSSNISLLKAYASTASIQQDRSRAIALVTGGVALGMLMGPAFQLLFTPIGFPGPALFPGFHKLTLSMYTAPALLACVMNLLNAVCIWTLFRENYAGVISRDKEEYRKDTDNCPPPPMMPALPSPDTKAMLLCHVTRFAQMFINTNLETLGAPLSMMMFAWTRHEAVKYIAIAQAAMSLLALVTYIAFILFRIDKIMNFRANLVCSLFALIVFHALTYSYSFLPGHVHTFSSKDPRNGTHDEPVGCDTAKFDWCLSVHPLPSFYFYACHVLFLGLAFPNLNVTLNTLFSQIIGPRHQGTQQGLLQVSGGLARMIGPIVVSSLYASYGPQSAWLIEIAVTAATLALWFLHYRRMVPLELASLSPSAASSSRQGPKPKLENVAADSDGQTSSFRRRKKRSAEERKPLVEPIEEEPDLETDGGQSRAEEKDADNEGGGQENNDALQRNDATVSTVASLGRS